MNNELTIRANNDALSVSEILSQKALIQDAMRSAMQDGQHFGKIPGCGDKPTLLQPGAQTILLLFRMNPDYTVEVVDMERAHREYRVKCSLTNTSGQFIGAGVGSCSTMEGKWRFRVAPKKLTDKPVPKGYWDMRKADPKGAQALLGGNGFSAKKNDSGEWMIAEGTSEKVEHDNPADYYNTCLKMAKKRALVDATLTRTAASDIFTQDIEDIKENLAVYEETQPQNAPIATQRTAKANPEPEDDPFNEPAAPKQAKISHSVPEGAITLECNLVAVKEVSSKAGAPKPWKAWFATFEDDSGNTIEAGTFDHKVGENLPVWQGGKVALVYQRSKSKPDKFEIVSVEPTEVMP